MATLELTNQDHDVVVFTARIRGAPTNGTLHQGDSTRVDGGPNDVGFAWRPENVLISEDEYTNFHVTFSEDATLPFGNPPGRVR